MRVLGEKPLLIKSRWCYFGWHNWTQYGEPKNRKEGIYVLDYQLRNCASCNLMDVKVLRSRLG